MPEDQTFRDDLLVFVKALADANRLKIIGLLAQAPRTVEQLSRLIGLTVSTTSHHLSRLSEARLVSARADGHYYWYSLETANLQSMAQRLLKEDDLKNLVEDSAVDPFEKKVMAAFVEEDGRIKAFPAQLKKYQVLLRYVVQAFEEGPRYTEKEVNQILSRFHEDTAKLRRDLVDYHLMDREGGGRSYWKVPQSSEVKEAANP